ncbi:hypothetical protein BC831DRAFT_547801 [Entophlyctis helioformis]|nr:hypothetical protein BC831DRAFT_547801 [Entophlyctis helioformis]
MRTPLCKLLQMLQLALVCAVVAVAGSAGEQADEQDVVCEVLETGASDCFPRVFVPTNEFQRVRKGQVVPKGLHIRLDWQTGQREAKLVDADGDGDKPATSSDAVVVRLPDTSDPQTDEPQDEPQADEPAQLTSIAQESAGLPHQQAASLAQILDGMAHANTTSLASTLAFLQDVVDHVDYGADLLKSEAAVTVMVRLMSDPSDTGSNSLSLQAAHVLGTALSNNRVAQERAAQYGLVAKLWRLVEQQAHHRHRYLFTFGALVRSNPTAIREFVLAADGLDRMASLYTLELDSRVRRRLLALFGDLLDPSMTASGDDGDGGGGGGGTDGKSIMMQHTHWRSLSNMAIANEAE